MLSRTQQRLDSDSLPLWNAVFCLDCEVISNSRGDECLACNGRSLVSLARILGGSVYAHREYKSRQNESGLFNIAITVELRGMSPYDLTTTLEKFTDLIGPKLTQDQAIFHVNVRPSEDVPKAQGSLCFQEREAA